MMSMSVAAMAAGGNHTITIDHSVSGHHYAAYQIFKGDLADDGTLSNIDWGSGVNGADLLAALQAADSNTYGNCKNAADAANVLAANGTFNNSTAKAFAEIAANYTTNTSFSSNYSDGNHNYTIAGLDDGYYLIRDTAAVSGADAQTEYILTVTNDTEVTPKSDVPESQKKVKDANDTAGTVSEWQDSADYDIGDSIPFQLTATLPDNYSEYKTYTMTFHDTEAAGLDFQEDTVNVYVGENPTPINSDLYNIQENTADKCTFEITIPNVKNIQGVTDSSVIRVEYESVLNDVYPTTEKAPTQDIIVKDCHQRSELKAKQTYDEVKVVIPVFPGTNCEYDSKRAFERAGATVQLVLMRNKTAKEMKDSVDELEAAIRQSQIMMLPGGFSAGDEPEGSGKFIATVLRSPQLKEAIDDLLDHRDGLMIGICNGFQALIKLGLLPYGHIKDMDENDPTLTFNTIGRHLSQMVDTRIASVKSPWLAGVNVGDIHTVPISHGEGRFVAPKAVIEELFENGQVFSQYVDSHHQPTMVSPYNPNGSMMAIEGIISRDGRVLGKMAHSERQGENRNKNIYGEMDQKLFEAGVNYFKGGK